MFETKEEQVAFYNGYNIEKPDDRLAWQNKSINQSSISLLQSN